MNLVIALGARGCRPFFVRYYCCVAKSCRRFTDRQNCSIVLVVVTLDEGVVNLRDALLDESSSLMMLRFALSLYT
eukprot:4288412-Amphidinium_carterae.3